MQGKGHLPGYSGHQPGLRMGIYGQRRAQAGVHAVSPERGSARASLWGAAKRVQWWAHFYPPKKTCALLP